MSSLSSKLSSFGLQQGLQQSRCLFRSMAQASRPPLDDTTAMAASLDDATATETTKTLDDDALELVFAHLHWETLLLGAARCAGLSVSTIEPLFGIENRSNGFKKPSRARRPCAARSRCPSPRVGQSAGSAAGRSGRLARRPEAPPLLGTVRKRNPKVVSFELVV